MLIVLFRCSICNQYTSFAHTFIICLTENRSVSYIPHTTSLSVSLISFAHTQQTLSSLICSYFLDFIMNTTQFQPYCEKTYYLYYIPYCLLIHLLTLSSLLHSSHNPHSLTGLPHFGQWSVPLWYVPSLLVKSAHISESFPTYS